MVGSATQPVKATDNADYRMRGYTLFILMLTYMLSGIDRLVMPILIEPIRKEFMLSDTQLGFISGLSFAIFYAIAGIPLGLLADRSNRRNMIAYCVAFWSLMTCACGMAQNFVQLIFARFGVGAGESGGPPAAMSILADLYPPGRLSTATAIYYLSTPLASIIALTAGGLLTDAFGWRTTFILAGAPGVLIAIVILLTIKEPNRNFVRPAIGRRPNLKETLTTIIRVRSLRSIIAGGTLIAMAMSAIGTWIPAYLARTFDHSLTHIGLGIGPIIGVSSAVGVLAGGYGTDLLAKNDDRRRLWLLAAATLISAPIITGTLLAKTYAVALLCFGGYMLATAVWYGPFFALIQRLCRRDTRSTTIAIVYLLTNLIGYGLGSQLVGIISDLMPGDASAASLRAGMLTMATVGIGAGLLFARASFTIRDDLAASLADHEAIMGESAGARPATR